MNRRLLAAIAILIALPAAASAYGVLAHEAIVDAAWDASIAPVLRARYHATDAQLAEARAYAYGGAIIQDSGYYPLSSRTFGDLTHYVRSGDFVEALLREARDVDEYAFALGALAHYVADNRGHPLAINRAAPMIYPKVGAKFGPGATYEDNPTAHLRTEFGFDVVEVARGEYAPQAYHDFIGFAVSTPVLERAVRATYGLELKDVFGAYDLAIGTFRWAVSQAIPSMTKVAWQTKRREIAQRFPEATAARYQFGLSRADFEHQWGTAYKRPGVWHRVLGWVLRVMPKIGPLRSLAFRTPTPAAERLFLESVDETTREYRTLVAQAARGRLDLTNRNFDTGQPIRAGAYRLADDAYAGWVHRLAKDDFAGVTPAIRASVLAFYSGAAVPAGSRSGDKASRALQADLRALELHQMR